MPGNDEQRDLEKLYNALEENGLVMRTNMDGIQISPILSDLLKKLTDIRNEMNGNTLPAEIEIPFPVVSDELMLPTYAFWEINVTPPQDSEDNRTHTILTQESNEDDVRRMPSINITTELPVDQITGKFNLSLSSTNIIPSQLCYGSSGLPVVSPLINQIQLGLMGMEQYGNNDNLKPLEICSHQIYLNIWDEFETSVSAENEIRQQMKNVRKSPIPELRNFDEKEIPELSFVDWQFQMHNYFSEMTLFKSEMLTLPFPFNKNESISFSSRKFPKAQAIVVMDNFLLGVYLEAISKNSTIQAQLPNRLSIKTVNELLQAIESIIFLPQSPDAIGRRQSLFHKLTQGEGETTSALFNRILLYFRMFEYSLRTKDLIDLIGCMYMTFKNRSLFVQTRDKCLSAAKNGRLDIQAISRNIVETESAMRDLGQTLADDALSEQLFFAHQDRKTCYICNLPGHIASRCPNRTAMDLGGPYTQAVDSTSGTQRCYASQQYTSTEQTSQRYFNRGGDRRRFG